MCVSRGLAALPSLSPLLLQLLVSLASSRRSSEEGDSSLKRVFWGGGSWLSPRADKGPLGSVASRSQPARGPCVCLAGVRGSLYPSRGSLYPSHGSLYLSFGSLCPPRGSLCPPRGSLCPPRGSMCPSGGSVCPSLGPSEGLGGGSRTPLLGAGSRGHGDRGGSWLPVGRGESRRARWRGCLRFPVRFI